MDTIFQNLALGFQQAFTLENIIWIFIGGLLGTIVGMLPGIGPSSGIAILIPIIYGMNPTTALITMTAVYYGAMFGGSRASILINTPGDSSSIVTCFDGYPMTKNGQAGKALAITAIASFIGAIMGIIMIIFLTQPVASAALKFGPAERFSLMLFALTAAVVLSEGNILKGFFSMAIGFMLSTVGMDPQTGAFRYTFGIIELHDGIDFLVAMIGLFAVAEVFRNYKDIDLRFNFDSRTIGKVMITIEDFKKCFIPMLRNTPLGFVVGVLPGMGGAIATFMTYAMEKQLSRHPEKFGKGAIEGVAAPEASNNASACGAMVPLLTLGIPGSPSTAVMLGALMLLGVKPGPLLFQERPEIAWGLISAMVLVAVVLLIINLPLVVPMVQLLKIPQRLMLPLILGLGFMGAYFLNYSSFDFILLSLFGICGYFMSKLEIPIPPLVLALILGSFTEQSFRNAMVISNLDISIFFTRPISLALIILAVISVMYAVHREIKIAQKRSREF